MGRVPVLAAVLAVTAAAPAYAGTTYCVGVDAPGCTSRLSLDLALQDARTQTPGPDVVLVGSDRTEVLTSGAADAPGEPVAVAGAGAATRLRPALRLSHPGSRARGLAVEGGATTPVALEAPTAADVTVTTANPAGTAVLVPAGGVLVRAVVDGPIDVLDQARLERVRARALSPALTFAGRASVHGLDLDAGGDAPAVVATCPAAGAAEVLLRHVTLTGDAPLGIEAGCAEPDASVAVELHDSVIALAPAAVAFREDGESAAIATRSSLHPDDPAVTSTDRIAAGDPRFEPGTHRPAADSPLVDAGGAEPLGDGEALWDLGGRPRVADGNGDGVLRRDAGAWERPAAPAPVPDGNVLGDPGAETGTGAWTSLGGFAATAFGTLEPDGADLFPTAATGEALGAGRAFFAGGEAAESALLQRIDLAASARAVDTGGARAALSGLLGGYGRDADLVRLTATFRDPAGVPLGSVVLDGPAPADRGNATTLLPRSAQAAIPARTRAVDVVLAGTRVGGDAERFNDAYADNLALVLSVPGIPVAGPVDPGSPPVAGLKPFAGITVLSSKLTFDRRARARVRIACASATVGLCKGRLDLRRGRTRIARYSYFTLAPGRRMTLRVNLLAAQRRRVRRLGSFLARIAAVAVDGQGLQRRTTVPLRARYGSR